MVRLDRIYTRTGDAGVTRLATGEAVSKADLRVEAYGAVDETNSAIGVARQHTGSDLWLDQALERIQNDLFDLGADLATPDSAALAHEALRIVDSQVTRIEQDIDLINERLAPLNSFILPAGSPLAASLHLARATCRRAERETVRLAAGDPAGVAPPALKYLNRLSDFLFVASRRANGDGAADVLWRPAANR